MKFFALLLYSPVKVNKLSLGSETCSIVCSSQSAQEFSYWIFSLQAGCRARNRLMKCMHGMKKYIYISGNSATKSS